MKTFEHNSIAKTGEETHRLFPLLDELFQWTDIIYKIYLFFHRTHDENKTSIVRSKWFKPVVIIVSSVILFIIIILATVIPLSLTSKSKSKLNTSTTTQTTTTGRKWPRTIGKNNSSVIPIIVIKLILSPFCL